LRSSIAESEVNDRAIERFSVREEERFINGSRDLHCRVRIFECGRYVQGDQGFVFHHKDGRANEI
jgi:hypothetical protein